MIHYSSSVPQTNVIKVPCGMNDDLIARVVKFVRIVGFNSNANRWTPAEERVVMNFRSWLYIISQKEVMSDADNGAFVHVNLNTGETHVFVGWNGASVSARYWD